MLKLFKKETKHLPLQSNINSLLREGSDFFSNELILLNERLSGNLFCAEKTIIEQNGILSGNITSKVCVISGTVNGDVLSTEQTEIKSTAVILGDIRSPSINIQLGAIINGNITMEQDANMVNLLDITTLDKVKKHAAELRLTPENTINTGNRGISPPANIVKTKKQSEPSAPVKAPPNRPDQIKQQTKEDDINQKWW
jgi:cytoskeletal protein CcmA (bactofilin family)